MPGLVGRPTLGLAEPDSGREVRLDIDATFSVTAEWSRLQQHDDEVLPALDSLSGLTIAAADTTEAALRLRMGESLLDVRESATT